MAKKSTFKASFFQKLQKKTGKKTKEEGRPNSKTILWKNEGHTKDWEEVETGEKEKSLDKKKTPGLTKEERFLQRKEKRNGGAGLGVTHTGKTGRMLRVDPSIEGKKGTRQKGKKKKTYNVFPSSTNIVPGCKSENGGGNGERREAENGL